MSADAYGYGVASQLLDNSVDDELYPDEVFLEILLNTMEISYEDLGTAILDVFEGATIDDVWDILASARERINESYPDLVEDTGELLRLNADALPDLTPRFLQKIIRAGVARWEEDISAVRILEMHEAVYGNVLPVTAYLCKQSQQEVPTDHSHRMAAVRELMRYLNDHFPNLPSNTAVTNKLISAGANRVEAGEAKNPMRSRRRAPRGRAIGLSLTGRPSGTHKEELPPSASTEPAEEGDTGGLTTENLFDPEKLKGGPGPEED